MRGVAVVVACSLATACATTVASVDHQLILQPAQSRYELAPLELFVMPMELESPPPEFPAAYAQGDVAPLVVCAEVWLDADGDATQVAVLSQDPDCPQRTDARSLAFQQAVIARLRQWMWGPARICRFPARLRQQYERGDCTGNDVEIVSVPVRLAYAFSFQRSSGRVSVGSARIAGRRDSDGGSREQQLHRRDHQHHPQHPPQPAQR